MQRFMQRASVLSARGVPAVFSPTALQHFSSTAGRNSVRGKDPGYKNQGEALRQDRKALRPGRDQDHATRRSATAAEEAFEVKLSHSSFIRLIGFKGARIQKTAARTATRIMFNEGRQKEVLQHSHEVTSFPVVIKGAPDARAKAKQVLVGEIEVEHLRNSMNALQSTGEITQVIEIYKSLELACRRQGTPRVVRDFIMALRIATQAGHPYVGKVVYKDMLEQINEFVSFSAFHTFARCCIRSGDIEPLLESVEAAEEEFEMSKESIIDSVQEFYLTQPPKRGPSGAAILRLIIWMEKSSHPPSRSFEEHLWALLRRSDPNELEWQVLTLEKDGQAVSDSTMEYILLAVEGSGDVECGARLVRRWMKQAPKNVRGDTIFQMLIKCAGIWKKLKPIKDLLHDFEAQKKPLQTATWHAYAELCAKSGDLCEAMLALENQPQREKSDPISIELVERIAAHACLYPDNVKKAETFLLTQAQVVNQGGNA